MVFVRYKSDDKIYTGILLAKYDGLVYRTERVSKRFLWKTRVKYQSKAYQTTLYLLFIPWKHQIKEIIEVEEALIINKEEIIIPDDFIHCDEFISSDCIWYDKSIEREVIKNFTGYKFIFEDNKFMVNYHAYEQNLCLEILYQNLPIILEIDIDNEEY